jgi:hypothetical protein
MVFSCKLEARGWKAEKGRRKPQFANKFGGPNDFVGPGNYPLPLVFVSIDPNQF